GQYDFAFLGVMNGVAHEVVEYLAQPYHVRQYFFRDVRVYVRHQRDLFRVRQRLELVVDIAQQIVQVHYRVRQLELVFFDLVEIEDVVDELQQVIGGEHQVGDVFFLLFGIVQLEQVGD